VTNATDRAIDLITARLEAEFQSVAGPGLDELDLLLQPATFDLEAVRNAATIMDDEAHRSSRDRSRGQFDFPFRQLHLDLGGRWSDARCGQCDKVERQCDKRHGNIPPYRFEWMRSASTRHDSRGEEFIPGSLLLAAMVGSAGFGQPNTGRGYFPQDPAAEPLAIATADQGADCRIRLPSL